MTVLQIPQLCLVALVGVSGSGKSTFAARHFGRYEVISSDVCRGLVSNDENDQAATNDAFDVLGYIAGKRLAAGHLTVVDATNVSREGRAQLVALAREHDVLPVAIVLDVPVSVAVSRNAQRSDRDFGARVVKRQHDQLRRSLRGLAREGFRTVHVLSGVEEVESATITRTRLYSDRTDDHGPFDVIGDVHGCLGELVALLERLGYVVARDDQGRAVDAAHPDGRRVIFLGDLVDRGPDTVGVLRLAMGMTGAGHALAVPGNHEQKLVRALDGKKVTVSHGLETTLAELADESADFRAAVRQWCYDLVSHLVLDGGNLVVAHAGLKQAYHGRSSGRVRAFALYGDTTGETDEYGLPVRYPWATDYRGRAMVLYGHTPVPEVEWVNNTACLDTGCVFGGHLTALRYPEREIVQVPAQRVWYQPAKPFPVAGADGPDDMAPAASRRPDELDITDVLGIRGVETGHHGRVSVRAEQAAGALEAMSRFALHPRWLGYLPPTMSPVATSSREGLLEHPDEAFAEFAWSGDVESVICQEKHMGSRAVVLVCRDSAVAARRFGAPDDESGVVYTRTGRAFFDRALTEALLGRVRAAADTAGLWDELETDWLLLDAELLPWSVKAEPLLREQYAAVGAAARLALSAELDALQAARDRGLPVGDLLERTRERAHNSEGYAAAYRRYVWPVDGLNGVQLAPFQLLAGGGSIWADREHPWHLERIDRLVDADPETFRRTRRLVVRLDDEGSRAEGVRWWQELTDAGGEGMVAKPLAALVRGRRGLVQPGIKVRGREYLRIIYGPDYTVPENLTRLRERHLGTKRSLALREYALGIESLTRLVAGEPLWRVHEPVFAVLALESEPVDPRL
jgi:polynucleotide kinase-phosphatase